ncbi:hypothetical protein AKJ64_00995 [candidate division MSBL1 archaeon SCGC-AAA259E17]|uniref:Polyprenyl synthetase n=1 Tax=candidate division MSBL1 archaeon SCGC-AAA259E17 TaxID=1698263 RepID=A0A133UGA7_9EURY|nr:hypothetical protein AKJ64_00995 [candidate division MSBL1 archaeon SCGC-AAA259E17]
MRAKEEEPIDKIPKDSALWSLLVKNPDISRVGEPEKSFFRLYLHNGDSYAEISAESVQEPNYSSTGLIFEGELEEESERFEVTLAINSGDYANALSFQSILDCDFPRERRFEVVRELVETQKKVYEGQCLDLILHETSLDEVGVEDILRLHRLKTASYTVTGPLKMGFLLSPREFASGADDLDAYGRKVGVAFQVKDDLLGLFGEEEEIGKSVTSDIEEGKRTLPLVMAYQRGTESQKEKMESIVGSEPSEREFETIREIVKETGAKKRCEEMAEGMVEEGRKAVEGVESDFLNDLAGFVIGRSY